jgi:hypothetical protein
MSKICKELNNFFGVEIRNEDVGGVSPATLFSALDSWQQAPDDVRESWAETKKIRGLNTKIRKLIARYGRNKELSLLVY